MTNLNAETNEIKRLRGKNTNISRKNARPVRRSERKHNAGADLNQDGIEMPSVRVMGVTANMVEIEDKTIAQGRFISDSEVQRSAKVCVIGTDVVDKFFPNQNPLGQNDKSARFASDDHRC